MSILQLSKNQDGQIMMVVSMMLMVGLTVTLSIFLDSYANLRKTRSDEKGEASIDISEASVEDVLMRDYTDLSEAKLNTAGKLELKNADLETYNVNFVANTGKTFSIRSVKQDTAINVDLGGITGTLNIAWTNKNDTSQTKDPQAVLLVEKWSGSTVNRYYLKPLNADTITSKITNNSNGNIPILGPGSGNAVKNTDEPEVSYVNLVSGIDVSGATSLRIRFLYNGADIFISCTNNTGNCSLPEQKAQVKAVPSNDGQDEIRSVQVERYKDALPEIFDYVLFTGKSLQKTNN